MMGEHTPGPWEWLNTESLMSVSTGEPVLTLSYSSMYGHMLYCNDENKALLAAAPILLAALEHCATMMAIATNRDPYLDKVPHWEEAGVGAERAIALATMRGEER